MARDYQERKGNTIHSEGVLRGLVIKWSVAEKTATGQKLQRAACFKHEQDQGCNGLILLSVTPRELTVK